MNLTHHERELIEAGLSDYLWAVWEKKIKSSLTIEALAELHKLYDEKIFIDPLKEDGMKNKRRRK